jgi:acetyltransferase-like isoleucine patch superfamily enzyme
MIGSTVIFVGPVDIKGHCIIATGAVLKGMFLKPFRLIGGVPAKEIKVLEADAVKYFTRKNPHIS